MLAVLRRMTGETATKCLPMGSKRDTTRQNIFGSHTWSGTGGFAGEKLRSKSIMSALELQAMFRLESQTLNLVPPVYCRCDNLHECVLRPTNSPVKRWRSGTLAVLRPSGHAVERRGRVTSNRASWNSIQVAVHYLEAAAALLGF